MEKIKISILLFVIIFISLGNLNVESAKSVKNHKNSQVTQTPSKTLKTTPKSIKLTESLLSANELNKLIQTTDFDKKFRLLEANLNLKSNSENDFKKDHIPKAIYFDAMRGAKPTILSPINFPEKEPFRAYLNSLGISNDHHIILYDKSDSGIYDSTRVWWVFTIYGHNKLSILNGGLKAWKQANFTVNNRTYLYPVTNFTLNFNKEKIRNFTDVFSNVKTKKEILVDGRDKEDFLKNNIPNSVNLPYLDLFNNATARLKDLKEIRALFYSKGIGLTKPIIVSCLKGLRASALGYVSNLLGAQKVALYPGSWTDYSQQINSQNKPK